MGRQNEQDRRNTRSSAGHGDENEPPQHTTGESEGAQREEPTQNEDSAAASQQQQERYLKVEKLGEGTYGVVYKAKDQHRGIYVALKKVRCDAWGEGMSAISLREISVLKQIDSPNVVKLDDVFVSFSGNLYMVFELLDRDLKQYMDHVRSAGMNTLLAKSYVFQLLNGSHQCHINSVLHRDLKPQNVLLSRNGHLKLADFGLARPFTLPIRPYTHEVVTLWYRAPEVLLGAANYNAKVDSWSVGCMMAEMVNGSPLFAGDSEIDQLYKIFQGLGTPNDHIWKGVSSLPNYMNSFPSWPQKPLTRLVPGLDEVGRDLLMKLLAYDPVKRISCADAMNHPWFDEISKQNPEETALASMSVASGLPAEVRNEVREREEEAKKQHVERMRHIFGNSYRVGAVAERSATGGSTMSGSETTNLSEEVEV